MILGLFKASSRDSSPQISKQLVGGGNPISWPTVTRDFAGITIVAEDRGPVYAVWLKRTDRGAGEVLEFAEIPWGEALGATDDNACREDQGFVVWLTGLPRSGKTTLAFQLRQELHSRGRKVEVLDGDELVQQFNKGLGFSKEDRDERDRRIAYVAQLLARNGVVVIVAAISAYQEARDSARKSIGQFVEVYVKCPVEVCIERDYKGHYEKALSGEIPNFTGISDPYEPPISPEVVVETDRESVEASQAKILNAVAALGYVDLGRYARSSETGGSDKYA